MAYAPLTCLEIRKEKLGNRNRSSASRRASKGILDLDYKKAYRGGQAFDVV